MIGRLVVIMAIGASLAGTIPVLGQSGDDSPGGPRGPVITDNARFGDPTSTARGFQNFKYGVIKKIGKSVLVLDKTEFGDDQEFTLSPKTKFIQDGKPSSLERLKVGDKVWIDLKKDKKKGIFIAQKVVTGVGPTEIR